MIEVINLSKEYKKKKIINNSSFILSENKISFLMGVNGSGKTTFIKCIMDLETYSGKVLFDGKECKCIKEKCLVLWDDCPFYTNLSGIKNLILFSEGKKNKNQVIESALKYLDNDLLCTKVHKYSYGQKKKLALALVDILQPRYLIMDEISNGLDYDTMKFLKNQIKKWATNTTILLTGHQFDFYNDIVDNIFILKNSEITPLNDELNSRSIKLEEIYDKELH